MHDTNERKQGWRNTRPADSIRHSLARKGISTTAKNNTKMEELKELSDAGTLTWTDFKRFFGDESEETLQRLVNENKAEVEAELVPEVGMRQRLNEGRIKVDSDGEMQELSLEPSTPIRLIGEQESTE
ncbi:MAG: hypothetical protein V1837_06820 [Candidatus Woesearchaeota archaeon]